MLDFQPISFANKDIIQPFFSSYGEGSCQNSFVTSYLRRAKYQDHFCIYQDFLLIYRAGISTEKEKKFLFPIGDYSREKELQICMEELLDFCEAERATLSFPGITPKAVEFLQRYYPDKYSAADNREYYEYMFSSKNFAELPGKLFENRRWQMHKFEKLYEGRYEIRKICLEDLEEIEQFHYRWLETKQEDEELEFETEAIQDALAHFEALGLFGILIKLDGKICGFNIGSRLSDTTADGLFLKGDREVRYIYTVLFHQFAKLCCQDIPYINGEEDLGIEGLRNVKLSYIPEYLIQKYSVVFQ